MKALVIGAAGGVGSALLEELNRRDIPCAVTVRPGGRPLSDGLRATQIMSIDYDRIDLPSDVSVVFDTVAIQPEQQRRLLRQMAGTDNRYLMLSSTAVYADTAGPITPITESARVVTAQHHDDPLNRPQTYGPRKLACELQAAACDVPSLIVRAGMLVGPTDTHRRLNSYLARTAIRDTIVWPGDPRDPLQVLDLRDLARWMVNTAISSPPVHGIYNATGALDGTAIDDLRAACAAATGTHPHCLWLPHHVLLKAGVRPFLDLPLWPGDPRAFYRTDASKAAQAGLESRPLNETARASMHAGIEMNGSTARCFPGEDELIKSHAV